VATDAQTEGQEEMTHLVLFASPGVPGEPYRSRYEHALDPVGDVAFRWIDPPAVGNPPRKLSQAFKNEAHRCRQSSGRVLPNLMKKWAPGITKPWTVSFVGFSAGCWIARDGLFLSEHDRRALACSVMLDGAHTPYGPQREPREHELSSFIMAARAHRLIVVHSDTPTSGYSSTTEVADALRQAEAPCTIVHRPGRHHHGDLDGPGMLSSYLGPVLIAATPISIPPTRWDDGLGAENLTLGERLCAWHGFQFGMDPREIAGPRHNATIKAYSLQCRRGGTLLGVDKNGYTLWQGGTKLSLPTDDGDSPWCAALQSAGLLACLRPGEKPPHGARVSVRELVEDARDAGTLREASWEPRPGSAAILARYVYRKGKRVLSDPLSGGSGHVRCVIQSDGAKYHGIGGNEGDKITSAWHLRADPLLRGWIER